MNVKICENCGKRFFSKSKLKKYCSKSCASEMTKRRLEEDKQLCIHCKKACGGCNWSDYLKPVTGWIAEATIVKDSSGDFSSYKITKCPEFIRG